jgi:adenine/guanine phosphoribosyltransferase-like PRPP-binding protein/orotidine-5'-phosphate decarboxylase
MKPVILAVDGYPNGHEALITLGELISNPFIPQMVSFIKLNDVIHDKDIGSVGFVEQLVEWLQPLGIGLMLDFKLADITDTVVNVLKHYSKTMELARQGYPVILTVRESVTAKTFITLRKDFPGLKVAVVTTLTDMSEDECRTRYGMTPSNKILIDCQNLDHAYITAVANDAIVGCPNHPFDFVVCSPRELKSLQSDLWPECGFVCPGIRDQWMDTGNQKRTTGIKEAIKMADSNRDVFFVMGSQLVKGNPKEGISATDSIERTFRRIQESDQSKIVRGDVVTTMINFDALYHCPTDAEGHPTGLLVAYAGKYDGEHNYVGLNYFNVAQLESNPVARFYFTGLTIERMNRANVDSDMIIGVSMGGLTFASLIATEMDLWYGFAEKVTTQAANLEKGISKDVSVMKIRRHQIPEKSRVLIFEDVCNNFSTTNQVVQAVKDAGGEVVEIVCIINRSDRTEWNGIPVISVAHIPTAEYRQDDPFVAKLVEKGRIAWNPKAEWQRLRQAMV